MKFKAKGFTLIELLVVISIIALLSSIVLASLSSARSKARDSQRIQEIKQIQTALELYRQDNGRYPASYNGSGCGATSPNTSWCNSIQSVSGGHWIREGSSNLSKYFGSDPVDPKPASSPGWTPVKGGTYFYYSSASYGRQDWYMIVYGLENPNSLLESQDGVTACNGQRFHYGNGTNGVLTVGASCGR